MGSFGRFLLRLILVPLGIVCGALAAIALLAGMHWQLALEFVKADPKTQGDMIAILILLGPIVAVLIVLVAGTVMLPATVGILIAEGFAIRSWIFHVLNGGASGWVGLIMLEPMFRKQDAFAQFLQQPMPVIAAGLAAGFAYWLVAGWSAGFWKPAFAEPQPAPPPA